MRVVCRVLGGLIKAIVLLLFTPALYIWLSAKLTGIPRVSAWRALAAFLLCGLITVVAGTALLISLMLVRIHPASAIPVGLLSVGLWFLFQLVVFRSVLRTDWRKASLVWVLTLVMAAIETVALSVGAEDVPSAQAVKTRAAKVRRACANRVRPLVQRSPRDA